MAGLDGSGCKFQPLPCTTAGSNVAIRFLIEGLFCVVIGFISYFMMPASITEPALIARKKGGGNRWWNEHEEKILVNRLLRDDPTKGDLNNRAGISFRGVMEAFMDFNLWPIYIVSPQCP